jgi:hypothetical protein
MQGETVSPRRIRRARDFQAERLLRRPPEEGKAGPSPKHRRHASQANFISR